jgi:hypothetical protein
MCPTDEQSFKEGGEERRGCCGPPNACGQSNDGDTPIQPTTKSVRVDRGDVGPPSNIKRWENCATQDSSERSLASSADAHSRHPEGVYAKCGVLQPRTDEV